MMLHQNRRDHPSRGDATLDRVRLNDVITQIAFGGRRRSVYTRITALSGAAPGALLVADFRPSHRRHSLHSQVTASRHGGAVPLEDLAAAAGLRIEARGDLPLLRYVRAIRPGAS